MRFLRYMMVWSCAAAAVCGCGCGNQEPASNSATAGRPAAFDLEKTVLLDVRSQDEFASGHLRGALNIPHDMISEEIATVAPDKSAQVILYCRSGRRADTALKTLKSIGYENVLNLGGLEDAQKRLGLPVESN